MNIIPNCPTCGENVDVDIIKDYKKSPIGKKQERWLKTYFCSHCDVAFSNLKVVN